MQHNSENFLSGYVRLYRSIVQKSWFKMSAYVHLWAYILMMANHKIVEVWFRGGPKKLRPGEFLISVSQINEDTGINRNKIERILKTFESEQQIEQQKSNKGRLIRVLNWENYQKVIAGEQQSEKQVRNNRETSEKQVRNNRETSEKQVSSLINKNEKNIPPYSPPSADLCVLQQNQVRALADQICDYFSITEIRQANHVRTIHGFVRDQLAQENFDYLEQQFEFYKKFKTDTGQTKHSWRTWIESAWNERDWKAEFETIPKAAPRPDTEIQPGNHKGPNPFLEMLKPEFRNP